MTLKHKYLYGYEDAEYETCAENERQHFVSDNEYDPERCLRVYKAFVHGFPDERAVAHYYAEFLVGQCLFRRNAYAKSKFLTLPGSFTYEDGTYTLIRDEIYDYGNALSLHGTEHIENTVDQIAAELNLEESQNERFYIN